MPKLIAPYDCDLPTLGRSAKAGDVVEFPADGSAPAWPEAKTPKGDKPTPKEG